MMKTMTILALTLTGVAGAAQAQPPATQAPAAEGPTDTGGERVNQVIVYGNDPCPPSTNDEIVVCVRSKDEPYRLPKAMRNDPNAPGNDAWGERARSIEYVGRTGTGSCTPVGQSGMTGCFNQIVRQARAERASGGLWKSLVEAERAKRLGTIDADSEAIEAEVRAEEAADAARQSPPVAPPPPDAGPPNL